MAACFVPPNPAKQCRVPVGARARSTSERSWLPTCHLVYTASMTGRSVDGKATWGDGLGVMGFFRPRLALAWG